MITRQKATGIYRATEDVEVIGETAYCTVDKDGNPGSSHFLGLLVKRVQTIENLDTGSKISREAWEQRLLLDHKNA